MQGQELGEICARKSKAFSGQIADVLDRRGLTKQIVDGSIHVGDADGVVILPSDISVEVLEVVGSLASAETDMCRAILDEVLFSDAFDRYQVG